MRYNEDDNMLNPREYQKILSSKHRLFDLHLREAFEHRNLATLFVRRDFVSAYKQTIFGPIWFFLNPIFTTLIFTVIFGSLAGLPTLDIETDASIPSFLFFMAGNVCWGFFSNTFTATSNSFRSNAGLMSKVYYPRILSPIATALSNLITFGLQLALFFIAYGICAFAHQGDMQITWRLLLIPLLTLQMMFLAVGCGIFVSSVTTKYRDLNMAIGIIIRFWQYATPIMYGLALVTERAPNLMWLYMLNPMTPMVTMFRYCVFGFGYFYWRPYLVSWIISLTVFLGGLVIFSRIERSFVDTI